VQFETIHHEGGLPDWRTRSGADSHGHQNKLRFSELHAQAFLGGDLPLPRFGLDEDIVGLRTRSQTVSFHNPSANMPKLQGPFTLKGVRETRERSCGAVKLRFFSLALTALQLAVDSSIEGRVDERRHLETPAIGEFLPATTAGQSTE
jgi:hypothetical protein